MELAKTVDTLANNHTVHPGFLACLRADFSVKKVVNIDLTMMMKIKVVIQNVFF